MSKNKSDLDGFIKKGSTCEYTDYCEIAGARCLHKGENKKTTYYCGYCKSFRIIDQGRLERGEKTLIPQK